MFGHLKPEQFIAAMDRDLVSRTPGVTAHLNSCPACAAQLRSMETVRNDLTMEGGDIPEPDWTEFRDSVRLELLSRSIQRETAVRRWTGWSVRPTMAWVVSLLVLLMISTGGFFLHVRHDLAKSAVAGVQQSNADSSDVEAAPAWTGSGVFQQLSNLEEPQMERLQLLIQSAQTGVLTRQ